MNNIFTIYCIIAVINAVYLVKGISSLKINSADSQPTNAVNDIIPENEDFLKRTSRHAFGGDGIGYPYVAQPCK